MDTAKITITMDGSRECVGGQWCDACKLPSAIDVPVIYGGVIEDRESWLTVCPSCDE